MEVTSTISIDPHSAYHFGYQVFRAFPDLTTEVNSSNDLNKNRHYLIKMTVDVTLTIQRLHICTSTNRTCNRLNQLKMVFNLHVIVSHLVKSCIMPFSIYNCQLHYIIKHYNIKHYHIKHYHIKHYHIKHYHIKHYIIKQFTVPEDMHTSFHATSVIFIKISLTRQSDKCFGKYKLLNCPTTHLISTPMLKDQVWSNTFKKYSTGKHTTIM